MQLLALTALLVSNQMRLELRVNHVLKTATSTPICKSVQFAQQVGSSTDLLLAVSRAVLVRQVRFPRTVPASGVRPAARPMTIELCAWPAQKMKCHLTGSAAELVLQAICRTHQIQNAKAAPHLRACAPCAPVTHIVVMVPCASLAMNGLHLNQEHPCATVCQGLI